MERKKIIKRSSRIGLFLALTFFSFSIFANREDSLLQRLKTVSGAERVKTLNDLAGIYIKKDPQKFLTYHQEAMKLCGDSVSLLRTHAINNFANYLRLRGKTAEAKSRLLSIIKQCNEKKREDLVPDLYSTLAMTYKKESLYDSAIYYALEADKLFGKQGNIKGRTLNLSNCAGIYVEMEEYDKAGKNYETVVKLATENNMKPSRVSALIGMGIFYGSMEKLDSAIYFLEMAAREAVLIPDYDLLSTAYSNLGTAYRYAKKEKIALGYYIKNYELKKQLDSKVDMATSLCDLANIYTKLKKTDSAYYCIKQANAIADSLDSPLTLAFVYEAYIGYFTEKGDYKSVADYYKRKSAIEKKIFSEQKQKSLNEMETLYEIDKKEAELKLRGEQLVNNENKLRQQKIINIGVILGLILVLLFAFNFFRSLQKSRQANATISAQKVQVEAQKALIEEKQKEILDSINYAQRIQKALLASRKLLDENLKDYFVLFLPKDIVSGDFYWSTVVQSGLNSLNVVQKGNALNNLEPSLNNVEHFYLAVCDSTGHGVPGALMSMLNIACLNEALNERGIRKPGDVLSYCREKIIRSLSEDGSKDGGSDGMDGSLIQIDGNTLHYSSANNSLYIIRNNELIELSVDKMPVGRHERQNIPFTNNTIELKSGDIIYLMTDGYSDQFGASKGKKFTRKELKQTLLKICNLSMAEQEQILLSTFNNWKGQHEQTDDVTLVGIKV